MSNLPEVCLSTRKKYRQDELPAIAVVEFALNTRTSVSLKLGCAGSEYALGEIHRKRRSIWLGRRSEQPIQPDKTVLLKESNSAMMVG